MLSNLRAVSILIAAALIVPAAAHAQDSRWNVVPGVYQIRNERSHLCASFAPGSIFGPQFVDQVPCSTNPNANFAIVPAFRPGQYIIHVQGGTPTGAACATVARGVIFGNPRIDIHACDGSADLNFVFAPTPSNLAHAIGAENEFFIEAAGDGQCWDVRDGSTAVGTDFLKSPCSSATAEMFFSLVRLGAVSGLADVRNSELAGFVPNPSNASCPVTSAGRLVNWNLFGSDITPAVSSGTVDIGDGLIPVGAATGILQNTDNDAACHQICIRQCGCRAYSWVRRGVQSATRSVCWVKNPVPRPNPDTNVISGYVRP